MQTQGVNEARMEAIELPKEIQTEAKFDKESNWDQQSNAQMKNISLDDRQEKESQDIETIMTHTHRKRGHASFQVKNHQ